MNQRFRMLSRGAVLLVALALLLMPAAIARAGTGGNADISGEVHPTTTYYTTQRVINTPSSSGPDIAALEYTGPTSMKLGAHDCSFNQLASAKTINDINYVGLVGDGTTVHNQVFCMFTQSGGSTGSFSANLDWD
jgi:hypothetical protein